MNDEFDDLLSILQDDGQPLPLARLKELSDLDSKHLSRLRSAWSRIPDKRRQRLIVEIGQLADRSIEVTFERVNRFAMGDDLPEIRRRAIQNLWECDDPALARPLITALGEDASAEVRAAAAAALGPFVFFGETEEIPAELLHRIEEALLAAHASDSAQAVRLSCLESLGYSSRKEVATLIRAAYASGVEDIMRSALCAMGRSADDPWSPMVLAELTSASPALRLEAARAAGELELREAVPGLVDLLEDVHDDVRRAAIWSLGELGGEEAKAALARLAEDAKDEGEVALLQEALENLDFVDGTRDLFLFNFDEPGDLLT
jgi:HEAT repeat protein